MGFSGGGNGTFSLPNHTHTNAALNGGALQELVTLVDAATLKAWGEAKNKYHVIENYKAVGTASTKTFTFPATFNPDTYSKLVLEIDIEPSAALNLLARVNGSSAATYFSRGVRVGTASDTFINLASQTSFQLASSTILAVTNEACHLTMEFYFNPTPSNRNLCALSWANPTNVQADERLEYFINSNIATFDSITILTSTSTWKADTRMTLYGVKRT